MIIRILNNGTSWEKWLNIKLNDSVIFSVYEKDNGFIIFQQVQIVFRK